MCRLLVITVNHGERLGKHNEGRWQRGDLGSIKEDGVEFGGYFNNNHGFIIIEIPGVPKSRFLGRLSPETELAIDPITGDEQILHIRKRLFKMDIPDLESKTGGAKLDGRKVTVQERDLTFSEKPPIIDMAIL